jgi:hypothetical protein
VSGAEPLLEVRDLRTYFHVEGGLARAVLAYNFLGDGLRDALDPKSFRAERA